MKKFKGKKLSTTLERVKKRLSGYVEYDAPHPSIKFNGIFKLENDPKITTFNSKNVLFAGTKLCSSWIMGLVIYNGQNTKILTRLNQYILENKKRGIKKTKISAYVNKLSIFMSVIALIQAILAITMVYSSPDQNGAYSFINKIFGFTFV